MEQATEEAVEQVVEQERQEPEPITGDNAEPESPQPHSQAGVEQEGGEESDEAAPPKWRKSIDRLTRQRYERDAEIARLRNQNAELQGKLAEKTKPKQEDFKSFEEYQEALVNHTVTQKLESQNQKATGNRIGEVFQKAHEKYPDFMELLQADSDLPIHPEVINELAEMEGGHDAIYWLARNPEETRRIAKLPPAKALIEIGRIQTAKDKPGGARTTKAAPPVPKVNTGGGAATRNPEKMSHAEFRTWRKNTS